MGCFLGGVHHSSPKLLCPFHIWLPLPSTSRELKTDPRHRASTVRASSDPIHAPGGPRDVSASLQSLVTDTPHC